MTFLLEGKGDRAGGMGVGGVRVCVLVQSCGVLAQEEAERGTKGVVPG